MAWNLIQKHMNLDASTSFAICGLEELASLHVVGATHVLSLLDPDFPEPDALQRFDQSRRISLRFHDAIAPAADVVLPNQQHVEEILSFGRSVADSVEHGDKARVLIHCHSGVSRATAAAGIMLAHSRADQNEDDIFAHVIRLRPRAWPNYRMIEIADKMLSREGRLIQALGRLYVSQLTLLPRSERFMRENGFADASPPGTWKGCASKDAADFRRG
jgi:predicted protein tyrosine phosphatase